MDLITHARFLFLVYVVFVIESKEIYSAKQTFSREMGCATYLSPVFMQTISSELSGSCSNKIDLFRTYVFFQL